MITLQNAYGTIDISDAYLATLLSEAVRSCFGVVDMATSGALEGIRARLSSEEIPNKGVRVCTEKGKLTVELHVIMSYGVNMKAIVKSIINRVSFTVEQATGLIVEKVNVYVDGLA